MNHSLYRWACKITMGVMVLLVLASLSGVVASPTQAAPRYPWEQWKPQLHNPVVVNLDDGGTHYTGRGNDVLLVASEPVRRRVVIRNVRNIVSVGLEIQLAQPMPNPLPPLPNTCDGFQRMNSLSRAHVALVLANVSGMAYFEGLYINGTNGHISEGVQTYDTSGRNPQTQFYFVNTRFEGAWTHEGVGAVPREVWPRDMPSCAGGLAGRPRFNKPDLFEGMYGGLYHFENVTARGSAFQGIYWTPEHNNSLGEIRLRNVNVASVYRQAFAIHKKNRSGGPVWTQSDNVWLYHDPSYSMSAGASAPYMYFAVDKPDRITGSVTNGTAYWNEGSGLIKAGLRISRGHPPGGDFAPANRVGSRYDPAYFVLGSTAPDRELQPRPSTPPTPPLDDGAGATNERELAGPPIYNLRGIEANDIVRGNVALRVELIDPADNVRYTIRGPRTTTSVARGAPWGWEGGDWRSNGWPDGVYTVQVQACRGAVCGDVVTRTFQLDNAQTLPERTRRSANRAF